MSPAPARTFAPPPPAGLPPAYPGVYASVDSGSHSPYAAPAGQRPIAVRWACLLTWTFSTVLVGFLVIAAVELTAHPQTFLDQAHRQNPRLAEQGISDGLLRGAVYGLLGVILLWALAAVVLAVLAWRRSRWAMIALMVSAGMAGGTAVLMSLFSPVLLPLVAACVGTVVLLLRPDVRRWYRRPPLTLTRDFWSPRSR